MEWKTEAERVREELAEEVESLRSALHPLNAAIHEGDDAEVSMLLIDLADLVCDLRLTVVRADRLLDKLSHGQA